ncbi:MAG TPA: universal stress protein [Usitatibacter sp.]|nr:universal stress protein [Usitatibacter sp.]
MYKHILAPTDGSALSANAVRTAAALARSLGARLTLLNVRPPYLPTYPDWTGLAPVMDDADFQAAAQRDSDEKLAAAAQVAGAEGIVPACASVPAETPWRAVIDKARELGCDLIVMASHGRTGVDALLLGSETTKVLTHSSIPVLVTR